MISIKKDIKMPVDCSVCFGRGAIWCRFDESDRIVVPALPDESVEGRPEWCPLVEVPNEGGGCSEIPNNSDGEYDPKPDIYYLAEKIGIHRLYALVVQLRGEPEPCIDTIGRQATIDAFMEVLDRPNHAEFLYTDEICGVLESLPSAQPETTKRIVGKSKDGMTLWYQCDMCYEPVDVQDNFCRGCGRRLTDG